MIRDSTDLPINVALSGGYDSEITLRSFVESGIPVTAHVARFEDGLNAEEVAVAQGLADLYQVPLKVLDLNLRHFWESEWENYANLYDAVSGQFMVHIWIVSQMDGFPVVGGGDPYLIFTNPSDPDGPYEEKRWYARFLSRQVSTTRYLNSVNRPGVPLFFYYTPEIMYSSFANPHMSHIVKYGPMGQLLTNSRFKPVVYGHYFPTDFLRPKRSGFERLEHEDMALRRKLRNITEHRNPQAIYLLDEFLSALKGEQDFPSGQSFPYAHRMFPLGS